MITHTIITLCFLFTMIYSAPLLTTWPSSTTKLTTPIGTETLPNITRPDSIKNKTNYELLGGGFEGDMILPKGFNPSKESKSRAVAILPLARWPNNVIPYDISAITSIEDRNVILEAMSTLMYDVGTPIPGETTRKSCVAFRPQQQNGENFVRFQYGDGCSGTVGYLPGDDMVVTLAASGCFYSGTIQHELIHVLGFFHEQSRPDRDSYITVNYENIIPDAINNFDKYVWGLSVLNQNTPYDLGSIMHYGTDFFSANGRPTITPKVSGVTIGQREGLSATDIAEIRNYYGCLDAE